jgi:hypothetical protein
MGSENCGPEFATALWAHVNQAARRDPDFSGLCDGSIANGIALSRSKPEPARTAGRRRTIAMTRRQPMAASIDQPHI